MTDEVEKDKNTTKSDEEIWAKRFIVVAIIGLAGLLITIACFNIVAAVVFTFIIILCVGIVGFFVMMDADTYGY